MVKKETFGQMLRKRRMEKEITLRKFAEMVGVSPTYISQIERDEFSPPSEEIIEKMAEILEGSVDDMLALAEKIPSDLPMIIRQYPQEAALFLRTAKGFNREDWKKMIRSANQQKKGDKKND